MRSPIPILTFSLIAFLLLAGCGKHSTTTPMPAPQSDDLTSLAARYPQDLALAKKAGLAVSVAEFVRPVPPADRNAAVVYDQMVKVLNTRPIAGPDQVLDYLAAPTYASAGELQAAEAALSSRADLVAFVHQAASRPDCYFVKNWTQPNPAQVAYPEMTALLEASHILTAQSLVMAAQGRPVQAVQNQALGFRIVDHAATEPTLTGYLLSTGAATTTVSGLQKILYMAGDNAKVDRAVAQAIAQNWRAPSLAHALSGESGFQQSTISYLKQAGFSQVANVPAIPAGAQNSIPPAYRQPPQWETFLDANGAFMAESMIPLVATADESCAQSKQAMQDASQRINQTEADPSRFFANYKVPASVQLPDDRAKLAACVLETQAGAAVLAWRAAHGSFPASLSQAMPKVPLDPYNGKPLGYRREGDGFVVYAVGPWGTFDGGAPTQAPSQLDTAFRYPLPGYLSPAH